MKYQQLFMTSWNRVTEAKKKEGEIPSFYFFTMILSFRLVTFPFKTFDFGSAFASPNSPPLADRFRLL